MKTTNPVDAARIELMLSDLRLPAIKSMWAKLAEQSDKEGESAHCHVIWTRTEPGKPPLPL